GLSLLPNLPKIKPCAVLLPLNQIHLIFLSARVNSMSRSGAKFAAFTTTAFVPIAMWICSKLGFFSIVKKGQPDTWQLRARSENDLRTLLNAASLKTGILSTPRADYAFRAVVGTEDLSRLFAVLVYSIDYPNFKSCL